MKTLHAVKPHCLKQIEIPMPRLPPGSSNRVLVRTAWVSLCGSDIPFFTGRKRFQSYPMAPGAPVHECIGEVVESASEQFKQGDHVLSIPDGNQGLAEYFLAQTSRTIPLKPGITDPGAGCIIQPLSTIINAMDRLGDLHGKSVTVLGLGSIGLMFCWLAHKQGAALVTGIDPHTNRCKKAEEIGARETICGSSIEAVHKMHAAGGGWNPSDIVIEAVGHQMDTLNDALELVGKRGTVLAFGVPDHPVYALEYEIFFRKNAILLATVTPEWKEYLLKAQDLFLANQQELTGFCTHRLPIREAQRAFEMYERQEDGVIKVAMDATAW